MFLGMLFGSRTYYYRGDIISLILLIGTTPRQIGIDYGLDWSGIRKPFHYG